MKTLNEFKKDFKRETVKKSLSRDLEYKLSKPLDEALLTLRELRNKFDNEYEDLHLVIWAEADYAGHDPSVEIILEGKRLETHEEFNKRIDLEYTRYQNQWDADRQTYNYLKKKFEG